ncbi:MAG: quinoprotein dehydrogenase-associated SoxYZ-like carrier [Proteobacteria bacterium]|nr:quinoprotein dehydrogenase-associated SoxYZ-like carrier [Pseudomonadota bacterium]
MRIRVDRRGACGLLLCAPWAAVAADVDSGMSTDGDPFGSLQWPELRRQYFGTAALRFDTRVQVRAPSFAEDPMNVPVSIAADRLGDVDAIVVIVDRNPIRKVLEYRPLMALPRIALRFKLEQASPVRAAVRTKDGIWHVGGTLVDSAGGGCTVPGASRRDGSWPSTLGRVSARVFPHSSGIDAAGQGDGAARVRVRVMHPMDTGLANGIPAFHITRLSLRDGQGRELLQLSTFEPVSENPVFSFDFASLPAEPLRLDGVDNNGNRIAATID